MQFADYRVEVIPDTVFRLDGGAMFGVVPRTLWERRVTPDALNRVPLNANCLFVETPDQKILIDTGLGDKWNATEITRYGIERERTLGESLRAIAGCTADEITMVVNSHLHFDHAGGNTSRSDAGALTATFPNARYLASRNEYDHACAPSERDRASYVAENWEPLVASGQLELRAETYEIAPGLTMETVPGHSRSMQCLRLERDGQTLFSFSDVLPTRHHLPLAWVMGYDLYPAETVDSKRRLLAEAERGNWICHLYHDPELALARVRIEDGKYQFAELN